MKYAVDNTGSQVRAEAGAPDQAVCPRCGAPVTLRRRQRSNRSRRRDVLLASRGQCEPGLPDPSICCQQDRI